MKTKLTITLMTCAVIIANAFNSAKAQTPGSIEMGNGYANEVFYSLTNGVVKTSPRNLWDIAFYTQAFSAGIITNDGNGVELYTYPKAAADGWDSFDTTGISTWKKMYNDASDWENGAFNRNQKGHPDYGWGIYSSSSHDVIGDSLFLIKTPDGIYRKLNIVRKLSSQNKYEIRFANLDGSDDQLLTLDVNPYADRAFMAFSFASGIVDREPAVASWDILFTKYYALVQNTPYPVVGVLRNPEISVARVAHTGASFTNWSGLDFETGADVIGSDWKYFDMGTFQYVIEDSLMYFIKAHDGGVYKLMFDGFTGSSTGIATFNTTVLSTLGIPAAETASLSVYPNPASGIVNVSLPATYTESTISLYDTNGRMLIQTHAGKSGNTQVDLSSLPNGAYIMSVVSNENVAVQKVMVSK